MKWFKRIAIAFVALLLLGAIVLCWLLGTASGLRFALARAQAATDGALQVQHASGRLLGPLDLAGIRYDDGHGTVIKVATAHLDLAFWPLFARRVDVLALDVDGIDVALPQAAPEDSSDSGGFSLQPPVDLVLEQVHVGSIAIAQGGQPLFAANRLDLAGSWTRHGLALHQLQLQAADGRVDLSGELALGEKYRGQGQADFAWKAGDIEYAGKLSVHSDGQQAQLQLELAAPTAAHLQLQLSQNDAHAWTAKLAVPRFDPRPLGVSALQTLAMTLQGHGNRLGGTLEGSFDLNDYRVLLQPLRAQFSDDFNRLNLQQLKLGSPQIKGQLSASGVLQLDAKPVSAQLDIRWDDLLLPADLVGQELASRGQLSASGSADHYHAEGTLDIGPPQALAKLTLNLDGTAQSVVLHALDLVQPQGQLQTSGTLTWQPQLAWQAKIAATHFDPGQLFAGWDGALDARIDSHGSLAKQGPDASLTLDQLSGSLRDRAVRGHGKLHLSPNQVLDGQLTLAVGASKLQLDARPGASNDAELRLSVASLGDWLPDASGSMDGHFSVRGTPPKLSINGQLHGKSLAWQQQRAESLDLIVGVPDVSHPAGKIDLRSNNAYLGGLFFERIKLLAEGSQRNHQLRAEVLGKQLSGKLLLHGSSSGDAWQGTLSTLDLQPQGLPGWRLQQDANLSYRQGAMQLSRLCLSAGDPSLCVAAEQDRAGNLDASYQLHALPLALALNAAGYADLPMRADGNFEGSGNIHRSAAGALSGKASISSVQGSITYTDNASAPLLRYDGLSVNAELAPASQRIEIHSGLDDAGRIDGHINLSGTEQSLAGELELHLRNLRFIELLSSEVANVHGQLDGRFGFAGTLQQPVLTGQAKLHGFAAEVPAVGLKLSDGQLDLGTTDAQQWQVDGSVRSGAGSLAIRGSASVAGAAPTSLTIKGSEFTAADIPALKLVISPDLTVKRDAKGLDIGGGLAIDSASVNLENLPGAGATQASPDVVIVDQETQAQRASQLPISARIKVDLGRQTHIEGMGLDGRVSGVLTVRERPGEATTGQGQIAVDGTYRAYGQDLHIQHGQLLFASTPIDNPGLDIRAIRKLNPNATIDDGQVVGLYVSGTAQRPILTVFSNPVMEQSDALSYLVTGKPLSQVKGGEGDMVGAAAQALGSAAGDLLAKSIGSKLGIDDIGVSSNTALGGSSAFTVGKYLSPRLYLSYGVGLFEPGQVITLRYRLSSRWNFEAQQATESSRASFNYRIEK